MVKHVRVVESGAITVESSSAVLLDVGRQGILGENVPDYGKPFEARVLCRSNEVPDTTQYESLLLV